MEVVKQFTSNDLHTEISIKGSYEKPLFRAGDIALILDIKNINTTIQNFNETEKTLIQLSTIGGEQLINFLTIKGLYKLLFRSKKPIAEKFQNWVCEVLEEIRLNGKYELEKQLQEKNKELEEKENEKKELEVKLMEEKQKKKSLSVPSIYIYNTDVQCHPPELKIGISNDYIKRIQPYKQICKNGKLELVVELFDVNMKSLEYHIHSLLSIHRVKDEVFKMDVEEAKLIILDVVDLLKTCQILDPVERQLKIKKRFETTTEQREAREKKISQNTISTQTEYDTEVFLSTPIIQKDTELKNKFKEFIQTHCIIREDVEVSTKKIIGQYRLWSKNDKKEITTAFKDYLDRKFKYTRLNTQNQNQVVNGYQGICLKEIVYHKNVLSSDAQTFLFEKCIFSPDKTVLYKDLVEEYLLWKKNVSKEETKNEANEIREYLKNCDYVFYSTVWSLKGGGQGYYGIGLKTEKTNYKKSSSTGKQVEKRKINTNELLGMWETIAKAATVECISSAKMSLSIRNKRVFNNDYYFNFLESNGLKNSLENDNK